MKDNTNKQTDDRIEYKIESKIENFSDTLEKGINNFSNVLDEKISNFDEEKFEEGISLFFKKIGSVIVCFFTQMLPKLYKKIERLFKSDTWDTIAPFIFLMSMLIIIAIIATIMSNLLF